MGKFAQQLRFLTFEKINSIMFKSSQKTQLHWNFSSTFISPHRLCESNRAQQFGDFIKKKLQFFPVRVLMKWSDFLTKFKKKRQIKKWEKKQILFSLLLNQINAWNAGVFCFPIKMDFYNFISNWNGQIYVFFLFC